MSVTHTHTRNRLHCNSLHHTSPTRYWLVPRCTVYRIDWFPVDIHSVAAFHRHSPLLGEVCMSSLTHVHHAISLAGRRFYDYTRKSPYERKCGVALDEPNGKHDGLGYFHCEAPHGVIVAFRDTRLLDPKVRSNALFCSGGGTRALQ